MATEKVMNLVEEVKGLTGLELSERVKTLEEVFGVSAAAPVAMMGGAAPAAAAEEEKTVFTPSLTDVGANKIGVSKVVRELTGLGLKEAKELVDNTPKAIKENVSKDEADSIKAKLEEAGAKVEIK